jgi:hypothetical protein
MSGAFKFGIISRNIGLVYRNLLVRLLGWGSAHINDCASRGFRTIDSLREQSATVDNPACGNIVSAFGNYYMFIYINLFHFF